MGTTMARWQPLQRKKGVCKRRKRMIRERELISPLGPRVHRSERARDSSPTAAGEAKEVEISF